METLQEDYSQNHEEDQYLGLIKRIFETGSEEQSRNGKVYPYVPVWSNRHILPFLC